jgi:hypothetical protein
MWWKARRNVHQRRFVWRSSVMSISMPQSLHWMCWGLVDTPIIENFPFSMSVPSLWVRGSVGRKTPGHKPVTGVKGWFLTFFLPWKSPLLFFTIFEISQISVWPILFCFNLPLQIEMKQPITWVEQAAPWPFFYRENRAHPTIIVFCILAGLDKILQLHKFWIWCAVIQSILHTGIFFPKIFFFTKF